MYVEVSLSGRDQCSSQSRLTRSDLTRPPSGDPPVMVGSVRDRVLPARESAAPNQDDETRLCAAPDLFWAASAPSSASQDEAGFEAPPRLVLVFALTAWPSDLLRVAETDETERPETPERGAYGCAAEAARNAAVAWTIDLTSRAWSGEKRKWLRSINQSKVLTKPHTGKEKPHPSTATEGSKP